MATKSILDEMDQNFISSDQTTIQSGPTVLVINGPLTGTGIIDIGANSILELNGSVASTETIAFTSDTANLTLGDPNEFFGTITGIDFSNTIDVSSIAFDTLGVVSVGLDNSLDIIESNTTITLQLDPEENFSGEYFHLSSDGFQGTDITESTTPCFLKSTLILTPDGTIKIEDLKIGDLIINENGLSRAVKWIGKRCYLTPIYDQNDVIPVLIKASALSENVPNKDLLVSPRHGIKIDEVIIPAGNLINGISVISQEDIQLIEYFHIELETHDVIFANNTPCETFIDDDSRRLFDNSQEYYQLYPRDIGLIYALAAPRHDSGPVVERIRRKIALRAGIAPNISPSSKVIGCLDFGDRQTITGWAYDPVRPDHPVQLDILNCGGLIARTIANVPRPDVRRAGFGNGNCGFSVTLPGPLPSLMRHEISVRPYGSDCCLTGSPVIIDPGISHDLLKCDLLGRVMDAAVKGMASPVEIAQFGDQLVALGKRYQSSGTTKSRTNVRKRDARNSLSVLILDEAWPTVTVDAGSNAVMSHMKAFRDMGAKVAFCSTSGEPGTELSRKSISSLKMMGIECYGQDGTSTEATIRSFANTGITVVYLHKLSTVASYGGLIRKHLKSAKIVYSIGDLHHLRLKRQAVVTQRPDIAHRASSVETTEIWAMQLADLIVTHSNFEAEYLVRRLPKLNIHTIPWAVAGPVKAIRARKSHLIAFIGSAEHAPNLDAVNYLAKEIMPIVWEQEAGIKCFVIGNGWSKDIFENFDARIACLGHVSDLRRSLNAFKMTVAPLRFGAGIKGKVVESMAAGIPCIMTDVAAEGLPLDNHLKAAISDGADFATKILDVYKSEATWRTLAGSGLKLIKSHFSSDSVKLSLSSALNLPAMSKISNFEKAA